jgi:hypothetical protein
LGVEKRRQWSEGAIWSTLEFCFTRNYGNNLRMRVRGGPTWWANVGGHVGEEHVGRGTHMKLQAQTRIALLVYPLSLRQCTWA